MPAVMRCIFSGLVVGLAVVFFSLLPVGELVELKGYDLLHISRSRSEAPRDTVIVAIDEPSFAEIGRQWPWPRSLHAQLIDTLARSGASVIAFDILFADPSFPEEDDALARAIRSAGNVVLAADIEIAERQGFQRVMHVEPYAAFGAHARSGIAKIPLDRDNVVRRFLPKQEGEMLFSEQIALILKNGTNPIPPQTYITFRHPPGSFRTVSYYQALHPGEYLPKDFFRGKTVFVGKSLSNATGQTSDYFGTPFLFLDNSAMMSGVELQATMAENVLDGTYVFRASALLRFSVLLGLSILGALLQHQWRPVKSALFTLSGLLLYVIVVLVSFDFFNLWLPTLTAVPALGLPYGVSAISAYLVTERKRREVRNAFGHYLSPDILDKILANPDSLRLGGDQVEVTILFSDIVDFTSMAEKMPPAEIQGMLNLYLTEMTKIIFKEQGTIDKYIGDAIMAFWGAPLADPDHPLRACRAAVAMQDSLASLQEELRSRDYPAISVRIGIHTGIAAVGNMGSEHLFNYTVIGDTVNLASRLESANKEFGTKILISAATYGKTLGKIDARALGSIRVKGKSNEVNVYELRSCL